MLAKLFAIFLIVPLIELALLLTIGAQIGIWATLAIIISTAMLGASLTRREGLKTWLRFQEKLTTGALPNEELLDGLMILVAGAVLLTPGFLTDAVGFILLIPGSRRVVKGWVRQRFSQHIDTPFREL
ncbi:FxsA family protein [Candidatus Entotheonella palauensis]|uniref:FxsA family protein n=1 Tax=Candidatus Entotheonella palauensis TaxID=93172 RepID=UPI000B7F20C8|nr:FxsA family protein [Candidatus Entotheonella palauensis]